MPRYHARYTDRRCTWARLLFSSTKVVWHKDHDGGPVHVEVEVANIDKDDGNAWVRLQATRARAIAARFPPEATPERIAAGLGTVVFHPVDYPEAYASVTVLPPTMVAWLAETFSLNG